MKGRCVYTTKDLILDILNDLSHPFGYDCLFEYTVEDAARKAGLNPWSRQATSAAIEELLVEKKIVRLEFWRKDKPLIPSYVYMLSTTRIVITNVVSAKDPT